MPKAKKSVLDRLEATLGSTLGKPATAAALRQLDVLMAGEPEPPLFRALYTRWDGGGAIYGDYRFLPIAQLSAKRIALGTKLEKTPAWAKKGWWNSDWYPFLHDGTGFLCLDLGGAFGGPKGQILSWNPKSGPAVAFANIEAFLEFLCLPEDKRKNPGFPHKGNGQAKPLRDQLFDLYVAGKYKPLLAKAKEAADWEFQAKALEGLERIEEAIEAYGHLTDPESLIRKIELQLDLDDGVDLAHVERDLAAYMKLLAKPPIYTFGVRRGIDAYGQLVCAYETADDLAAMARVFAFWQGLVKETDADDARRFNFLPWRDHAKHLTGKQQKAAYETALAGTRARIAADAEFARTASREFKAEVDQRTAQANYYAAMFATALGALDEGRAHLRAASKYDRSYLDLARDDAELKPIASKR